MALIPVRDAITYAHVREDKPAAWADAAVSARTPVANKAVLLVRRIDGQLQKWTLAAGAIYTIAGGPLIIRGDVHEPVPPI
jgi:hypothetical protein